MAQLGLPRPLAEAFARRGYDVSWLRREILTPDRPSFSALFTDRQAKALDVALARCDRFHVFGDYDVDGLTSAAIAQTALTRLGKEVTASLPSRFEGGYGLSREVVADARARGAEVLLVVDSGISACDAARAAREAGLELWILDHHEPLGEIPDAEILVDPCLVPGAPPLSAAGLALVLADHLLPGLWDELSDLAALGILADQVPLTGANRRIVHEGIERLNRSPRPGLAALIERSGRGRKVTAAEVPFRIAPRLNSVGRLGTPDLGLRLLLADPAGAQNLAGEVEALNDERRRLLDALLAEAGKAVGEVGGAAVVAVAGEGWHRGLVGIVASHLADRHGRPAFVVTVEGDRAQGSARAPRGMDVTAILEEVAPLLERFGGHRQAAGFELAPPDVPAFLASLRALPAMEPPPQRVDALVARTEVDAGLAAAIEALEPFGPAFEEPVFAMVAARISAARHLGRQRAHVEIVADGLRAVHWQMSEPGAVPSIRDLAGKPEISPFDGQVRLSLSFQRLSLWQEATAIWLAPPEAGHLDPTAEVTLAAGDEGATDAPPFLVTCDLSQASALGGARRSLLPCGPSLGIEDIVRREQEGWVEGWVGPTPPSGDLSGREVRLVGPLTPDVLSLWLAAGVRRLVGPPGSGSGIGRKDLAAVWRLMRQVEAWPSSHNDLPISLRSGVDEVSFALARAIFHELGVLVDGRPTGRRADLDTSPTFRRYGSERPCVTLLLAPGRYPAAELLTVRGDLSREA